MIYVSILLSRSYAVFVRSRTPWYQVLERNHLTIGINVNTIMTGNRIGYWEWCVLDLIEHSNDVYVGKNTLKSTMNVVVEDDAVTAFYGRKIAKLIYDLSLNS